MRAPFLQQLRAIDARLTAHIVPPFTVVRLNDGVKLEEWEALLTDQFTAFILYTKTCPALDPPSEVGPLLPESLMITLRSAWTESLRRLLKRYYDPEDTGVMICPSIWPPPELEAKGVEKYDVGHYIIRSFFEGGMPWPGEWIYDAHQRRLKETPMVDEIEFRTRFDSERHIVDHNFLRQTARMLRGIAHKVMKLQNVFENLDIMDIHLGYNTERNYYSLTNIYVRPCCQKLGLFSICLFVILEALQYAEQDVLHVKEALPLTQRILEEYGFESSQRRKTDSLGVDMVLRGTQAIETALERLRVKPAVMQGMGTYEELDRQIKAGEKSGASELEQTSEIQRLMGIREHFFHHVDTEDKSTHSRLYYLNPDRFPTYTDLADPGLVNARFPKPHPPKLPTDTVIRRWQARLTDGFEAFVRGETKTLPTLDPPQDMGHLEQDVLATRLEFAWTASLRPLLAYYYDPKNAHVMKCPSILPPPELVAKGVDARQVCREIGQTLFVGGAPWLGEWAYDGHQLFLEGTPEQNEIAFREEFDVCRPYVRTSYITQLVNSLRNIQNAVRYQQTVTENIDVLDISLGYNLKTGTFQLNRITVRPCAQRLGLFTICLFAILEACVHTKQYTLHVKTALPRTQEILSVYGFERDGPSSGLGINMVLQGEEPMRTALERLRAKPIVQKGMGNFETLERQINAGLRKEAGQDTYVESDQTPEIQRLLDIKYWYFRHVNTEDPSIHSRLYYLNEDQFPTAEQLLDPGYINARFPKPQPPPPSDAE